MLKKVFLALLLAGIYLSVVSCSDSKAESNSVKTPVYFINSVMPAQDGYMVDFKYKDGSKDRSLAELTKGKVVFLNFWGTWCGPCKKELPDIIEISKDLKNKDFIVIGVALERGTPEQAAKTVTEFGSGRGIDYVNFIGNQDITNAYGKIPAVPTTFIIDKNGKIVEKIVGARDKATFMASINRVLK
ncbi:MAG: TlpA family protein disulfide reductase [Candidatus Kapabacteria bacterium]|nr:TlpA family protein disulfide reductase [Ignavibacteriota bacterium]MCW5885582.1 TlpA family protein disulfide reductase [Candidatus Kapabacteria bacterium]